MICETPLRDVDDVDSRPSTPFSAVSSGALTCLSTTSGEAPGIEVITVICGNSMEGMSSCFSEDIVITPNTDAKTVISAISARFAEGQLGQPEHRMVSWGSTDVLHVVTQRAVPQTRQGWLSCCGVDAVPAGGPWPWSASSSAASSGFSLSLTP